MFLILLYSAVIDVANIYISFVYFWKQTSHHNGVDKEQCTCWC